MPVRVVLVDFTILRLAKWKTSFKSFMVALFPFSNSHKSGLIEIMFSAKPFDTMHNMFSIVRSNDDKCSHLTCVLFGVFGTPFLRGAHLSAGFSARSIPKFCDTSSLFGFFTLLVAKMRDARTFTAFRTSLCAKPYETYLLSGCRAMSQSPVRGLSIESDVKALVVKGLDLIKPVLLTFKQKWGKDKLDDLENEGVFTVLVESSLQLSVFMFIVSKFSEVASFASKQVYRTANIHATCCNVNNLIYATGGGDSLSVHASKLLRFSALSCVLPGSQGNSRSYPMISQVLGNNLIIHSF